MARQHQIEQALAARHLYEGTLVLYDLTSAAIEGSHCPLARLGYPVMSRPMNWALIGQEYDQMVRVATPARRPEGAGRQLDETPR